MITIPGARTPDDVEEGFTLIELMVVVLILGVLMAIAIPTFLSLTGSAKTNAAEADLTTAVQDEATYYTQYTTYGGALANPNNPTTDPGLTSVDAGINWINATTQNGNFPISNAQPAGNKSVSVDVVNPTIAYGNPAEVVMSDQGNGKYYWVDIRNGTVTYSSGTGTSLPNNLPLPYTSWAAVPG